MRTHGISEETKEKVLDGCFFGLVLFASTAVYLSFSKNTATIAGMLKFIPVALIVYLLVGNVIIWLYNRPGKSKIGQWFNGAAAVYWISIFAGFFVLLSIVLPGVLRNIVLVNIAVAFVCWLVDYRSFKKIAEELNGEVVKGRYLVVDLEECPRSVDAFCREIEDYCRKNRITLEFITRGKPAVVKMDGQTYHVELDSFYSQFGPMYALKFGQYYKK